MQSIQHSVLEFVGEIACANPKAYIYSCAAVGAILGIAIYGVLGWALGHAFGYGTEGAYLAEVWYAYWFATNVDELKARIDQQVEVLETLIKEHRL